MRIKHISLFCIPIALIGCALLGPDYKKPNVDTPDSWQTKSKNTASVESSINLSDTSWWNRFNDPQLNTLIEEALANNNDIQSAIGNISVAASNLQLINMAWIPTVSLGGSATTGSTFNSSNSSSNTLINNFASSSANGNNFNMYSGGLIPSYSINLFQQFKKTDMAKANLSQAKATKNAVRLTVISQVCGSYFTLLALNKQLNQQNQLVTHLESLLSLVKIQYKYGIATLNDVETYQQKLSQAKMQTPNIQHNIDVTQNALQVLLNKNPAKFDKLNNFNSIKTTGIVPVNLPSTVLLNRPDVIMSEEQLKMANANIGVATSNFFPRISLTTPIGGYNAQLGNLFNANGDFWAAQITAVMPILNLGLYSLVKEAKGQYYVAYYNYVKTVRSVFADVNNNLSGYDSIQKTYNEANILYTSATANATLSLLNYKKGYVSYPDSLSNIITQDNYAILLTQTKLQELQAIVSLYQSLAGGYNYKNTSTLKKFGDDHDV